MKIDIDKIASLARLSITEDKKAEINKQLDGILDYFAQIQSIETKDVEPLVNPHDNIADFREDQALRDEDFVKNTLELAPELKGRLIKVPPVVGGEE